MLSFYTKNGAPMLLLRFLTDRYLPARLDMKAGSADQMARAVRQFSAFLGHPATLYDLTDETLNRFLRSCLDSGLAEATVNSKRRPLLTLWRYAWTKRLVDELPRDVARCREPLHLPEAWSADQVERLVAQCRETPGTVAGLPARHWWSSLVITVYWIGSRISATRQVASADCNLAERYLIVRAGSPKQTADQLHRLPDQAVAAIAAHYDRSRQLIWPWPFHRNHFWKAFRRIVEASGIPAPRGHCQLFHRLRRTNLSYCAAVDLELARRQAGHTDAKITLKHYVDPRIAPQRSAVGVLPTLRID